MKRTVLRVAAVTVLLAAGVAAGRAVGGLLRPRATPPAIESEDSTPRVLLGQDRNGSPVSVQVASRTRPLVVFALSVDCPYCFKNLPNWREVARALQGGETAAEVLVLSVSSPERTAAYLEANRLPTDAIYVDTSELQALGLPGVPGTLVIDPHSSTLRRWVGVLEDEEVSKITTWASSIKEPRDVIGSGS